MKLYYFITLYFCNKHKSLNIRGYRNFSSCAINEAHSWEMLTSDLPICDWLEGCDFEDRVNLGCRTVELVDCDPWVDIFCDVTARDVPPIFSGRSGKTSSGISATSDGTEINRHNISILHSIFLKLRSHIQNQIYISLKDHRDKEWDIELIYCNHQNIRDKKDLIR